MGGDGASAEVIDDVGRELLARTQRLAAAVLLTVLALLGLVLLVLTVVSLVLVIVWVGLPLTVGCVWLLRRLADVHRRLASWLLARPVPTAYLPTDRLGLIGTPVALARDAATWRDLGWLAVNSTAGLTLAIGATVETILDLILWWLPRSLLLVADAHLVRTMLAPTESGRLAQRVEQLTASRAETVDTGAAELRRIERDLHDGAQARLVALGMSLGLAEEQLDRDPDLVRQLLAEARTTSSQALADLRDLVRGIHPPVLADRGLPGAVRALVLATPLAVEVVGDVPGRLPAPVESAAYFAVAEALTNVIKHSSATRARIELGVDGRLLRLVVTDYGTGGADPAAGGGLRGIQHRLAAFDGTVTVSSPPGGPTSIAMELPCASS